MYKKYVERKINMKITSLNAAKIFSIAEHLINNHECAQSYNVLNLK